VNNATNRKKITDAIEQILCDHTFVTAPKSSAFLRYVVLETLDGNASRIKAYTIAIDALGRPPSFDPQNDPSVRVMAKRIREMLTDYYSRTDEHEVVLQLNCGSYVPQFIFTAPNHVSLWQKR